MKYLAEITQKNQLRDADTGVIQLTMKKPGRPLMLVDKLDSEVQYYFKAVR